MDTGCLTLIWVWVISFIVTQAVFLPRKNRGSSPLWDKNYCTMPPKLMICVAWLIVTAVLAPLCMVCLVVMGLSGLWEMAVARDVRIKAKQPSMTTFQREAQALSQEIDTLQQIRKDISVTASLHREMVALAAAETIKEKTFQKAKQEAENATQGCPSPEKDSGIQNRFEIMEIPRDL